MSTHKLINAHPLPTPVNRVFALRFRHLILAVVVVFVVFSGVYLSVIRPWHVRWGATDAEVALPLPGDTYIPYTAMVSTRALTIDAPAEAIWPWLVQLGQGRAGWYSYDWIENLLAARMHNTDRILPEFQQVNIGDKLTLQYSGPAAQVTHIEPNRVLSMGGWTFFLKPLDDKSTRLIVRWSWDVGNDLGAKIVYYTVVEPWHFVMESGMMLGIKQRAEDNLEAMRK